MENGSFLDSLLFVWVLMSKRATQVGVGQRGEINKSETDTLAGNLRTVYFQLG